MILEGQYFENSSAWLQKKYLDKKLINPSYSLRSFAAHLGVSKTGLNEFIRGKRMLSKKNLHKIAEYFGLNLEDEKSLLKEKQVDLRPTENFISAKATINDQKFSLISKWYYIAFMALAKIPHSPSCPKWISKRLKITEETAERVLKKLVSLNYIDIKDNEIVKNTDAIIKPKEIPSASIRKYHKEHLDMAKKALDNVPMERRHFKCLTVAINPDTLPEIRKLVDAFEEKVIEISRQGDVSEVYSLNVNLIPLTHEIDEEFVIEPLNKDYVLE